MNKRAAQQGAAAKGCISHDVLSRAVHAAAANVRLLATRCLTAVLTVAMVCVMVPAAQVFAEQNDAVASSADDAVAVMSSTDAVDQTVETANGVIPPADTSVASSETTSDATTTSGATNETSVTDTAADVETDSETEEALTENAEVQPLAVEPMAAGDYVTCSKGWGGTQDTWGTCEWGLKADGTLEIGAGNAPASKATLGKDIYGNDAEERYYTPAMSSFYYVPAGGSTQMVKVADRVTAIKAVGTVVLPANSGGLFGGFPEMTSFDAANFDTSNVTSMKQLFWGSNDFDSSPDFKLKSIDLSGWDTSNVVDFSSMFFQCESLESANLSGLVTATAKDIGGMFTDCISLRHLDMSGWDVSGRQEKYEGSYTNPFNLDGEYDEDMIAYSFAFVPLEEVILGPNSLYTSDTLYVKLYDGAKFLFTDGVKAFSGLFYAGDGLRPYTMQELAIGLHNGTISPGMFTWQPSVEASTSEGRYRGVGGTVTFNGSRPTTAGAYTFKLTPTAGAPALRGAAADGSVTTTSTTATAGANFLFSDVFDSSLFAEGTSYEYKLTQVPGSNSSITYDTHEATVRVSYSERAVAYAERQGKIYSTRTASGLAIEFPNGDADSKFDNTAPDGAMLKITCNADASPGGEFKYRISGYDANYQDFKGTYGGVTFNDSGYAYVTLSPGESFTLSGLPDGYTCYVKDESHPTEYKLNDPTTTPTGLKWNKTETRWEWTTAAGSPVEMQFNYGEATTATAMIRAQVRVSTDGVESIPEEGAFTFTLTPSSDSWGSSYDGDPVQTVTNDANGNIVFTQEFSNGAKLQDKYYYKLVQQVDPDSSAYTYDTKTWWILVTPSESGGNLSVVTEYSGEKYSGYGYAETPIPTFTNVTKAEVPIAMPNSGGPGFVAEMVAGTVILVATAVFLHKKRGEGDA